MMFFPIALLLASPTIELGVSPLVGDDHEHVWLELTEDDSGRSWVDEAWRGSIVSDGKTYPVILVRVDSADGAPPMKMDMFMAADCDRNLLGIHKAWVFTSQYGDALPAPITELDMTLASDPLSDDDITVLTIACGAEFRP